MAFSARGLRLLKALEKYPKDKPMYFDNFNIFNKIKITSLTDECLKATLTVEPGMCNGYEIMHGGYISTLADIACLYGFLGKSGGRMTKTTNINVLFLNQVKIGEKVIAEAKTVKNGSSPVMEAAMYTENGSLVAKALASFKVGNTEFQNTASDIIGFNILKDD